MPEETPLEIVQPETTPEVYRDLKIDPPMPPLRVKFDPPIDYDGQTYTEVVLDFEKLNGKSFDHLERTFNRMYKPERNEGIVIPETKQLYHKIIMSELSGYPIGLFMKMPRRYYVAMRTECLKASGSSSEEEKI